MIAATWLRSSSACRGTRKPCIPLRIANKSKRSSRHGGQRSGPKPGLTRLSSASSARKPCPAQPDLERAGVTRSERGVIGKMKSIGGTSIAPPARAGFREFSARGSGKVGSRRSLNIVARRGGGIDCTPVPRSLFVVPQGYRPHMPSRSFGQRSSWPRSAAVDRSTTSSGTQERWR
jgi:hypothetical protein